MGASKRIVELYIQKLAARTSCKCKYLTIRFGNVLGSNGSVVQIFKRQIEKGGPLTITHSDMIRYFMTISEACQLVLQAAAIGENGQILMLEMGEAVKIIDLAKEMIKIYNLKPNEDIEIRTIGIRAGEKLSEELFYEYEFPQPTKHHKIKVIKYEHFEENPELEKKIDELFYKALEIDLDGIHNKIRELIPSYKINSLGAPVNIDNRIKF